MAHGVLCMGTKNYGGFRLRAPTVGVNVFGTGRSMLPAEPHGKAFMTKKAKARGGIVGSGFAANLHYEGIGRVYGTDVELIGLFSPTAANARRFAEPRGLRTFDSLEALLAEVDVVHVCTSPATHEAITVAALQRGVHAVVEKPLTGWFGDGAAGFHASAVSMQAALDGALASIDRMLDAEAKSKAMILYAENWVYAPAIQKEREIIEKTGAQVLWMHGEEAHSGSHSKAYGFWRLNGGGALIGKGVHPLGAALYLKRIEGRARHGRPIRPAAVSARTHSLTRLPAYLDRGFLRTDYHDVEDFSATHVVFEDGTIADIFASEVVMGGIHNWIEVWPTTTARSATSIPTPPCRRIIRPKTSFATSTWSRRSAPSRAGRRPRPTRTSSPVSRRKSRRSTARWPPASGPRATAAWPPTASRQCTVPTCRPNAAAQRCRCARTDNIPAESVRPTASA